MRLELVSLVVGIALLGAAMATRELIDPWWSNFSAAVLVVGLSIAALRTRLAVLLSARLVHVAIAVALGAALVVATHGAHAMAVDLLPALGAHVVELYSDIAVAPPKIVVVPLIAVVVVAEELLFRGVALALCRRRFATLTAGVVATMSYAVPHLIAQAWLLLLTALVMGAVFMAQRLRSDSLAPPIITHVIWSASIFSLWPLI